MCEHSHSSLDQDGQELNLERQALGQSRHIHDERRHWAGPQAHGHGPGHSHEQDAQAGVAGVLAWLRHTFAHSHAPHEQVDSVLERSDRGIRALRVSLVGLGVTALFQVVIVLLSGSVALLADTIHNFGDAATSIPLWIAFALARRGANRRFTYGYGRAEDLAGALIVLFILFSAVVAAYESVVKLVSPQPVAHLEWVAAAAIVGFLGNEAVAIFRIRVGREIGSVALVADGQHSRVDGLTSLAVLVGVVGVALGVPILDPLVGLGITAAILLIVRDAAVAIWHRLMDAIDPEVLATVEHAPLHVPGVQGVHQVRARWTGSRVHTALHITVDPQLSVRKAHDITEQVEQVLAEHVSSFGSAQIHVCPAIE